MEGGARACRLAGLEPDTGQHRSVARRGDWWAKTGLDRLTLVQRVEAEALQITPPRELRS